MSSNSSENKGTLLMTNTVYRWYIYM